MNRKKLLKAFPWAIAMLIGVLAAAEVADPARRHTAAALQPVSALTATDNVLSSLNVTAFAEDTLGMMWIGTSAGINISNGESYAQIFHDTADSTALPDDYINTLHRDRQGRMWVGTQNGVALHLGAARFRRFALPATDCNVVQVADVQNGSATGCVVAVTEGHHGRRAYRIDAVRGTVCPCRTLPQPEAAVAVPDAPFSLRKPLQNVTCTFRDSQGNVWVGLRNDGYQVVADGLTAFKRANANALTEAARGRDIVTLARVGENLLAGTTLRLYTFDALTNHVAHTFYSQLFDSVPSAHRELLGIVPADKEHAWLVGNRQVLLCRVADGQASVAGKAYGSDDRLTRLGAATASAQGLYTSSDRGLLFFPRNSQKPQRTHVDSPWFDEETQLATLHDGRILLFMKNLHLAVFSPSSRQVSELPASGTSVQGNIDPAFALEDSRGTLWLGTKRSGLYRMAGPSGRLERTAFLSDVHVQGMAEDSLHRLWITTLKDVVCYDPHTQAATPHPLLSSGTNERQRQYFDKALCPAPGGRMAFGSSDGCFLTDVATDAPSAPASGCSGLRIYALGITTADSRHHLQTVGGLSPSTHYVFPHDQNTLTLHFFHPDYAKRSARRFQWMLDGYDAQWQPLTDRHEARYANLPPGTYTFRLRLTESPSLPPVEEQALTFTIRPAWWASPAAWLFYALCALCLLGYVNRLYLRLRVGRLRLEQARLEREREQRTNEMNMSFFANISHEFRNPITLIAGPLLSLQADYSLPVAARRTLNRVCLSVNRMLRLIDQMLDFNQLETDALRLRVTRCLAARKLEELAPAFEETARVRGIGLTVSTSEAEMEAWMDTDKLEKILSNLFTNALKHTPDGGHISIGLSLKGGDAGERPMLRGWVENSGSHIPPERMGDVFKRYFQLPSTAASHPYGWGTGIGLYYVKRLVGLHHGSIEAANTDGGVAFRFCLPADAAAYRADELSTQPKGVMQIPLAPLPPDGSGAQGECREMEKDMEKEPGEAGDGTPRKRLLIVDDDTDVAQYIRSIFAADYDVVNRYSAEDALADIAEVRPDLVLSDVVMGRMSGYEFCARLKADLMLSHIPVVMVTAKSNMDEQVNGLRMGAVAYVTKPFDPAYLQAIVASQLRGIETLRCQLGQNTATADVPAPAAEALSEPDRRFMDELYALMERRSAEMELNVTTVCRDLLISQSKFNYKLKQLTGDTPGAFFRKYKLNRAAQMLREGEHTVAEVAMLTGFATAAHFSVAFKKQFGVVPSEYGKRDTRPEEPRPHQ